MNTNEEIALELGWTRFYPHWGHSHYGWHAPQPYRNATCWHLKVPDFEHDAKYTFPLMVEMWEAGFDVFRDPVEGSYSWTKYGDDGAEPLDDDRDETTDVKVATALDWLAWKKEGK